MEEWQREYIKINRNRLVEVTICNESLLKCLLSDGVLAKVDLETIRCGPTSSVKAQLFYDILETRTDGYAAAVKALAKCKQTGALVILVQGYAYCLSPNTSIHFLGKTKKLSEYFGESEINEIIEDAKNKLSENQYELSHENLAATAKGIILVGNAEPPSTSLYIPRQLFKRITVKKTVFLENCPDVFLFKGILSLSQLSTLVSQNTVSTSSAQLLRGQLTSRFLLLEDDGDWEGILKITCAPTHLIKYEEETKTYLLEKTTGGSNIIGQHLGRPQGSMEDENADKVFSEDDFVDGVVTGSLSGSGVCICDSPGMGKSLLLAKIATKIAKRCPNRLVAFISLSHFIQHLTKHGVSLEVEYALARNSVLEYLSTSPLSLCLLNRILTKFEVPMELFFDGFDEVNFKYMEFTKKLMREFTFSFPNTRVYVTSRPNFRHDLEASLGVIAFDITPFTEANQIEILVNFWKKDSEECVEEKLVAFAQSCLKNLQCKLTREEKNITGIPLLCRLLAQVYSRNAKSFSRSTRYEQIDVENACQFDTCLSNLYKNYVEGIFEKHGGTSEMIEQVKHYHIWMAMKILFPEFEADYSRQFNVAVTHEVIDNVMSMGILETRLIGNDETAEFVHRTFAEYFVAAFLADAMKNQDTGSYSKEFKAQVARNLLEVVKTKDIGEADDFAGNIFVHSVVVYFLNFFTDDGDIASPTQVLADRFTTLVAPNQVYAMLFGCLRDNYGSIFKLFHNILPLLEDDVKTKYKSELIPDGDEYFVVRLINVASVFSSTSLVDALFTVFRECFSYDLELVCQRMPLHLDTPLHFAIERAHAEKIQYFSNFISLKDRKLLLSSVIRSNEEGSQMVKRKIKMCKLLLSMDKELVSEASYILYDSVHVEILKTLIQEGANPFVESSGETVAHRAAKYMSSSDFQELCRFLIEDAKAEHLFVAHVPKWKSPLPHILRKQNNISSETCRLIFGIPGVDVNEMDGKRNNLFLIAVQEKHDIKLLNLLATFGANVHAINNEGRNALHLAALTKNTEILKILLNLGLNYCHRDIGGLTFLHIVASEEISPGEYHELVCELSAKGQPEIFKTINKKGQLPIHIAVNHIEVQKETLELLKSNMVDFSAVDNQGFSVLMYAAFGSRSVYFLKALVGLGVDIMMKNKKGETFAHLIPKHYTAEQYHELIEFLISNGYEDAFTAADDRKMTPLHLAALHRELLPETLELFQEKLVKEKKVDINVSDENGRSVLMCAAEGKRSIAFLRILMDMGADATAQNINGLTFAHLIPLHYSTEEHYQIMKLLFERGYEKAYQIEDKYRKTALHQAVGCLDCHQETWTLIKDKLVDTGLVNINSQDIHGNSIIMFAVVSNTVYGGIGTDSPVSNSKLKFNKNENQDKNNFINYRSLEMFYKMDVPRAKRSNEYLKTLVELGANLYLQNNDGNTFAHYVALYYSAEEYHHLVDFILSKGHQEIFSVVNKIGQTPLHTAVHNLELLDETLKLFIPFQRHIENINSKDSNGDSVLVYAVMGKRNIGLFNFLLESGADPYQQNINGDTFAHFIPIYYSAEKYHELVQFIVSKGHTNLFAVVNKKGQTPMHNAFHQLQPLATTLDLFGRTLFQTQIVNINSTDKNGYSILMYAVMGKQSVGTFEFLFEMGADLHHQINDGNTFAHLLPFYYSGKEYHELVQFIVGKGQETVFGVVNGDGDTPIHSAFRDLVLLEETLILFKEKLFQPKIVDISWIDRNGNSFFKFVVIGKGRFKLFKFLLEMGVDLYRQNNNGDTIVHIIPSYWSAEEYHETVDLIISKSQEKVFAVVNKTGQTPVHSAFHKLLLSEKTLDLFRDKLFRPRVLDINGKDENGNSILAYAMVGKQSAASFELLYEMGADLHQQNNNGDNFAHLMPYYFSGKEYHSMVEFIISKGQGHVFAVANYKGQLPLHNAVQLLDLSNATLHIFGDKLFQPKIVDIDSVDKHGDTLLIYSATRKGSFRLFQFLLEMGADLHVQNIDGNTAVHIAAATYTREHFHEAVDLLIKAGEFKVFLLQNLKGETALHYAVECLEFLPETLDLIAGGYVSLQQDLKTKPEKYGLNAVSKKVESVLHYAVDAKRSLAFVKHLISLGADWSVKCIRNIGLAHAAAAQGLFQHLKYFVELGCDVNAQDTDGDGILHWAVCGTADNIFEMVTFLLENGVDKLHKNESGQTAYECAIEKGIADERILNALRC